MPVNGVGHERACTTGYSGFTATPVCRSTAVRRHKSLHYKVIYLSFGGVREAKKSRNKKSSCFFLPLLSDAV